MNGNFTIALHILGFLASRKGEPLTSEVLASSYGTSPVVVRRELAKLQRAGLVHTQRGAGGGSTLARAPELINLKQAYEAVSEDTAVLARYPEDCSGLIAPILGRYVNDLLVDAERAMLATLERVTVANMDRDVRTTIREASRCKPR